MKDDHPVLTFAFVLANIISAFGWLFLAAIVVPRVRLYSRMIKWSAGLCFALSALAHAGFAAVVLFDPEQTAVEQTSSPIVLVAQAGIAISMWVVLTGIWVQVGNYELTPVDPTSEPGT